MSNLHRCESHQATTLTHKATRAMPKLTRSLSQYRPDLNHRKSAAADMPCSLPSRAIFSTLCHLVRHTSRDVRALCRRWCPLVPVHVAAVAPVARVAGEVGLKKPRGARERHPISSFFFSLKRRDSFWSVLRERLILWAHDALSSLLGRSMLHPSVRLLTICTRHIPP